MSMYTPDRVCRILYEYMLHMITYNIHYVMHIICLHLVSSTHRLTRTTHTDVMRVLSKQWYTYVRHVCHIKGTVLDPSKAHSYCYDVQWVVLRCAVGSATMCSG